MGYKAKDSLMDSREKVSRSMCQAFLFWGVAVCLAPFRARSPILQGPSFREPQSMLSTAQRV
jgi:hypothetical protein